MLLLELNSELDIYFYPSKFLLHLLELKERDYKDLPYNSRLTASNEGNYYEESVATYRL